MDQYRILLVEDEEHLQDLVKLNLELEGHVVKAVSDGKSAVITFKAQRFDLVVLDVMLPEMDGIAVCESLRLENPIVPILFISAKHTSQDRIAGLKAGADDYLVKPFELEELLLRVQILLKRGYQSKERVQIDQITFGKNWVDFNSYEFRGINGEGRFGKREIKLLKLLIENQGNVVSRERILETIWGVDVYPSTRTIDNYILNFRKYFEKDPRNPQYIHSVRGVGYKFINA